MQISDVDEPSRSTLEKVGFNAGHDDRSVRLLRGNDEDKPMPRPAFDSYDPAVAEALPAIRDLTGMPEYLGSESPRSGRAR